MRLNQAAFGPCVQKIAERARIDQQEARQLLQETARRAERLRRQGDADPYGNAARQLSESLKKEAARDRLDALRNAAIRRRFMDRIEANGYKDARATIESGLVNINSKLREMDAPVEELTTGMANRWRTGIEVKLKQLGMRTAFESGSLDDRVARELWALSQIGPKRPQPGDAAASIAAAVHAPLSESFERLRAAGVRADHATDYITRTNHDVRLMRDAGFDAWWEKTEPRLSERTFADLDPMLDELGEVAETEPEMRRRFGQSVYNALVTGVHLTPRGASGFVAEDAYIPPMFEGTRNIAKKLSHQRVLYWKDADAWMAHMREFGGMTTLYNTVHNTLLRAARHAALMEKFGTNPMASLNMMIRKVQEGWRDVDPEAIVRFNKEIPFLRNLMGRIDGSLNVPSEEGGLEWMATARSIENAVSLGAVGVTHISALPQTLGAIAPHYGLTRLETLANGLSALVQGATPRGAEVLLQEMGAFNHGVLAHHWAQMRLTPGDGWLSKVPGRTSALAAATIRLAGLDYVFENSQNGFRFLLMHKLGREIGMEHGQLDKLLRDNLAKYKIGETEWRLLRSQADGMHVFEGRRYATPKDFSKLSDEQIDAYKKPEIDELRQTVEQRRQAYEEADAKEGERMQARQERAEQRIDDWRAAMEKRFAKRENRDTKLRDWFNDKDLELKERLRGAKLAEQRLRDILAMGSKEDVRQHLDELRQAMEGERARMEAGEDEPDFAELFEGVAPEETGAAGEATDRAVDSHTKAVGRAAEKYGRYVQRVNRRLQDLAKSADEKLGAIEDRDTTEVAALIVRANAAMAEVRAMEARAQARIWGRAEQLDAMENALPNQIEKLRRQTRWELADNYAAFLAHAGRAAVVAAGAREQAWALRETRPGTLSGELARMFMQFKMWPLAVVNMVHGREIYAEQSRLKATLGIGVILSLSALGGYGRMAVRDLLSGSPPRDPKDPKTLVAALMQGGGIGLYGDFLFGETNRMGGGMLGTLAGPAIGDAARLADIFHRARDDIYGLGDPAAHGGKGHFVDLWPELAHYAVRHVPFANLIGLKGALDYLVWHHLYETLSPGYWERMNRRKQKETGRTMMGYSPGAGVPAFPGGAGGQYGFLGGGR